MNGNRKLNQTNSKEKYYHIPYSISVGLTTLILIGKKNFFKNKFTIKAQLRLEMNLKSSLKKHNLPVALLALRCIYQMDSLLWIEFLHSIHYM